MSAERNLAVVREVYDRFVNRGEFEVCDVHYRTDVVDHGGLPGAPDGIAGVKYTIAGLRRAFPDLHVSIDAASAHEDYVVIHCTWRGTFLGDLLGVRPTGEPVEFRGVVVWRLEEYRMAERWAIGVDNGMMAALGLGFFGRKRRKRG
ncbi:ester cyclase [Nocardia sp. 2]|uniref:Ester cyclase n=1 Tax=Nocardia acididurans TaxID=2802282 RepID=A0ABS1M799_9NOCA|nr:ester cyclase [Nocardia acididurans]MBL1076436.1 ester cyclase [Nocardia acididurans]